MSAKRLKALNESRKTRAATKRDQGVSVLVGAARSGLLRLPAALVTWLATWLELAEMARLAASCGGARRCVSLRLGDPTPMLRNLATLTVRKALSATRLQAVLACCTSLKRLVCTRQLLPTAALEALTHTTLTELHCQLEINNRRNLAALARLTALRALTWCASRASRGLALPVLPQLTSLTYVCNGHPASLLGLLRGAPQLHTLHLAAFATSLELLGALGMLATLTQLRTLSVACYSFVSVEAELVPVLNKLSGLQTLELWLHQERGVLGLDLGALALPALTSLRLCGQPAAWPAKMACSLVRAVELYWQGGPDCLRELFTSWPLVALTVHCCSVKCSDLLALELLELLAEPDFPCADLRTCHFHVHLADWDAETSAIYARVLEACRRARPELTLVPVDVVYPVVPTGYLLWFCEKMP